MLVGLYQERDLIYGGRVSIVSTRADTATNPPTNR
jgi:hypothetical protein